MGLVKLGEDGEEKGEYNKELVSGVSKECPRMNEEI